MYKDIIIICESFYNGNTMRLAKAMAYGLDCMVVNAHEALSMDLSPYKIVGLGSGIYFTSHHPNIMKAASQLNTSQKTFIFSTHGSPFLGKYHASLKDELRKREIALLGEFDSKGFDCTGPFILIGGGNKGRPNEKDDRKAIKFVSDILPQYHKKPNTVPQGHHVYVDDDCIACRKCVSVCPMHVFDVKAGKAAVINDGDCIHCSLCQHNCPSRAISIKHSIWDAIQIAKRHSKKTSL